MAICSLLYIGKRSTTPERSALLHKEYSADLSTLARVRGAAGICLGLLVVLTVPINMIGGRLNSGPTGVWGPNAPPKHLQLPIVLNSIFFGIGFGVFMASMIDATFKSGQWMRAARLTLRRFKADVEGAAEEALDLELQSVATTTAPPPANGAGATTATAAATADGVIAIPIPATALVNDTLLRRQVLARTKINRAFNRVKAIARETNHVFSFPLSAFFCVLVSAAGIFWYLVVTREDDNEGALLGAFVCPTVAFVLLVCAATVGDEFLTARAALLYPDVGIGLVKSIGDRESVAFTHALEKTNIGLELVHVTITSYKVLYVVFSMMVFAAYIIPK